MARGRKAGKPIDPGTMALIRQANDTPGGVKHPRSSGILSARRAARKVTMLRIAELLVRNMTVPGIATHLKLPVKRVEKLKSELMATWTARTKEDLSVLRGIEVGKLTHLETGLLEEFDEARKHHNGELSAKLVDRLVKIIEMRGRLLGLIDPMRHNPDRDMGRLPPGKYVVMAFENEGGGRSEPIDVTPTVPEKPSEEAQHAD